MPSPEQTSTRLPVGVLVVEQQGRPLLRLALNGSGVRIGAHPRNDLCLPQVGLPDFLGEIVNSPSGGHLAIACQGLALEIDGKQGHRHELRDGQVLKLGQAQARYIAPAARTPVLNIGATGQITLTEDAAKLSVAEGILIYQGPSGRVSRSVGPAGVRIGKDPENDLCVAEPSVSGFHALVYHRNGRYFLRDLDSTNGTIVNNLKVVEAELPFGAELKLGRARLRFEKHLTEAPVLPADTNVFEGIISVDPQMRRIFSVIERIAGHDAPVCITGESGTGKELVAQALHRRSPRARKPFVAVNLGAIPSELIEDELFGHEKGAYSGADKQRIGAFEQAQGGTLFLDEIGELALAMQPKLLRVLESRVLRRVGGNVDIELDARVISATHRNLPERVQQGQFREDLLHRLYVLPVQLPPLRRRRGDLDVLVKHFLSQLDPGERPRQLSDQALRLLRDHRWSGNVRELRNVLLRAILTSTQDPIEAEAINFLGHSLQDRIAEGMAFFPQLKLATLERHAIEEALQRAGNNHTAAADLLGINRSTLNRKIASWQGETASENA